MSSSKAQKSTTKKKSALLYPNNELITTVASTNNGTNTKGIHTKVLLNSPIKQLVERASRQTDYKSNKQIEARCSSKKRPTARNKSALKKA